MTIGFSQLSKLAIANLTKKQLRIKKSTLSDLLTKRIAQGRKAEEKDREETCILWIISETFNQSVSLVSCLLKGYDISHFHCSNPKNLNRGLIVARAPKRHLQMKPEIQTMMSGAEVKIFCYLS